jgi:hypothetical protein
MLEICDDPSDPGYSLLSASLDTLVGKHFRHLGLS